jgi:hypothetical protein
MTTIASLAAEIITENAQCARCGTAPRRRKSPYCPVCAKWINNQKRKQYVHRVRGVHKVQHGVTVQYLGCADLDHVSAKVAEDWLKAGWLQAGDKVIFPDRTITVGAVLEMAV